MTLTVRGNALPASSHRDAGKMYVSDRNIDNLRRLGVEADVVVAAKRGDEILDTTGSTREAPRADGVLTLSELDRLDEPANKNVLFPNERAAVSKVHALFEVPDASDVTLPPVKNLRYELERRLVSPAVTSVRIADLPAALQTSARRLQLAKDGDSDAETISRDDILWAKQPANSGPFTGGTMRDLDAIMSNFHDDIFAEKVVGILPPVEQRQDLLTAGPVKVQVSSRIGFHTANGPHAPYTWNPVLHQRQICVEAPAGYKVFVKSAAQVGTNVQFFEGVVDGNGASQAMSVPAINRAGSSLWVQVFDASGALVSNARVNVPVTQPEPFTIAAGAARRKVDEWRDIDGNVVPHRANGDRGIPGYSLDGHPHLFAREMIYTSL